VAPRKLSVLLDSRSGRLSKMLLAPQIGKPIAHQTSTQAPVKD
jgi:hypothetical protein